MSTYIKFVTINILDWKFNQNITFNSGLNIIAGTNGVWKTKLLNHISANYSNHDVVVTEWWIIRPIISFSPKRNPAKTQIAQAVQQAKNDPNIHANALSAIMQYIQDDWFQTIKGVSEYLAINSEKLESEDIKKSEATNQTQMEYNEILKQIFENYSIIYQYNIEDKLYDLKLTKDEFNFPIEQLSAWENAILSLVFAIYFSRNDTDVYIIDEPEIHLNRQLEEKLFKFLDEFAIKYEKQIIIVTHSRVAFIQPYLKKTQFLSRNEGNIIISSQPNQKLIDQMAGDIVKIIWWITTSEKMIYCEDKAHFDILSEISKKASKDLEIIQLWNCEDVKKMCRNFSKLQIENCFFLIDWDNKTIIESEYKDLIKLKKYCIQNYFLDIDILTAIDQRIDKSKWIPNLLLEKVRAVNDPYFNIYKKLDDSPLFEVIEYIDASKFIGNLRWDLSYSSDSDFYNAYIWKVFEEWKQNQLFWDLSKIFNFEI